MDYFMILFAVILILARACSSSPATYDDALKHCKNQGSSLASEYKILDIIGGESSLVAWLPYTKKLIPWTWINNTTLGREVVQRSASVQDQDCAVIRSADAILDESYCFSKKYNYLCTDKKKCRDCLEIGGKNVSVHFGQENWFEAMRLCERQSRTLAVFSNDMINNVVDTLHKKIKTQGHFWVGLTRTTWISDIGESPEFNYRWTAQSSDSLKCAVIHQNSSWQTWNCNEPATCICKNSDAVDVLRKFATINQQPPATETTTVPTTGRSHAPGQTTSGLEPAEQRQQGDGNHTTIVAGVLGTLVPVILVVVAVAVFLICRRRGRFQNLRIPMKWKKTDEMATTAEVKNLLAPQKLENNNAEGDSPLSKSAAELKHENDGSKSGRTTVDSSVKTSQKDEVKPMSESEIAVRSFLDENNHKVIGSFQGLFAEESEPFLQNLQAIMGKLPLLGENESLQLCTFFISVVEDDVKRVTLQNCEPVSSKLIAEGSSEREKIKWLLFIGKITELMPQLLREKDHEQILKCIDAQESLINTQNAFKILEHLARRRQESAEKCVSFIVEHFKKFNQAYRANIIHPLRKAITTYTDQVTVEDSTVSPKFKDLMKQMVDVTMHQWVESGHTNEDTNLLEAVLGLAKGFPQAIRQEQITTVIEYLHQENENARKISYIILDIFSNESPALLYDYMDQLLKGMITEKQMFFPSRIKIVTKMVNSSRDCAEKCASYIIEHYEEVSESCQEELNSLLKKASATNSEAGSVATPKIVDCARQKVNNALQQWDQQEKNDQNTKRMELMLGLAKVFPQILGQEKIRPFLVYLDKENKNGKKVMYVILNIVSKENPELLLDHLNKILQGIQKEDAKYLAQRIETATLIACCNPNAAAQVLSKYLKKLRKPKSSSAEHFFKGIQKIAKNQITIAVQFENELDELLQDQKYKQYHEFLTNILSTIKQEKEKSKRDGIVSTDQRADYEDRSTENTVKTEIKPLHPSPSTGSATEPSHANLASSANGENVTNPSHRPETTKL